MHSAALLFFELFELFDAEDWRDVESDQRPPQVQVRNSRERTGRPDLLLLLLTGGGGSAPPKKLPGSTAQQIVMANAIRMLSISTSCFRRLSFLRPSCFRRLSSFVDVCSRQSPLLVYSIEPHRERPRLPPAAGWKCPTLQTCFRTPSVLSASLCGLATFR